MSLGLQLLLVSIPIKVCCYAPLHTLTFVIQAETSLLKSVCGLLSVTKAGQESLSLMASWRRTFTWTSLMKCYSHFFMISLVMVTSSLCTSHTSLDASKWSEMMEDAAWVCRHQPHGEHVARAKGVCLMRGQAVCKGWNCGSYSSFLEYSGHCEVQIVHSQSQKGCVQRS